MAVGHFAVSCVTSHRIAAEAEATAAASTENSLRFHYVAAMSLPHALSLPLSRLVHLPPSPVVMLLFSERSHVVIIMNTVMASSYIFQFVVVAAAAAAASASATVAVVVGLFLFPF